MNLLKPQYPYHRDEILEATRNTRDDIADFYGSLSVETFHERPAKGWSAARNLRHLVKSAIAMNLGLLQPRFFLRLFFGNPGTAKARRLEETGPDYLAGLAKGQKAGIYAPMGWTGTPRDLAGNQSATIEGWKKALDATMKIVQKKWPDEELDRYRLPHPIQGKIPVREMLQFGLLHAYHHTGIVRERLKR